MESKPGEQALLAMKELTKKSKEVFKKPNNPIVKKSLSNKKYKIITEEEYIEGLSKIIQRDYFPDLAKLKVQNEYLDALASDDYVKLRQIYKRYQTTTPLSRLQSPGTFETPKIGSHLDDTILTDQEPGTSRSNLSNFSNASNRSISSGLSLDSFLDTYTSEDNQSFQEIIEAADRKLRQKYAALFDAEETTKRENELALALPGISEQFNAEKPKAIGTWTYVNQNALMYNPDGWQLTRAEQIEMAKQRQEIDRANTRLKINPFDDKQSKNTITDAAKTQAKFAGDKVGLDGKSLNAGDTPEIRGFSFVKTPSPMPGREESPLMTWGEISGTPFRLDGSDTPLRTSSAGPSFRIAETPKRDAIALELAGKVAEQQRSKKEKAIQAAMRNIAASPRVRSSFDRLASMSPAAQRFAKSKLSTPSPRRTPGLTPIQKKTPLVSPIVRKKTPLVNQKHYDTKTETLTDNLLDLPSKSGRPKATDYF